MGMWLKGTLVRIEKQQNHASRIMAFCDRNTGEIMNGSWVKPFDNVQNREQSNSKYFVTCMETLYKKKIITTYINGNDTQGI